MSTPSRSVWSGQSPRSQSGAHPIASASVASAMPTDASVRPTVNNSTTPLTSTVPTQPASTPPPQTSFQPRTPLRRPTDDIILQPSSPSKPKSNKKPLIIGVIALAGAAAVAGLIFLMTGALRGSAPVEAADAKGKFNIYANYLLFGTDSKDPIQAPYDEYELYEFSAVFNGNYDYNPGLDDEGDASNLGESATSPSSEYPGYSEASAEYFDKTRKLFNNFYDQYQSEDKPSDDFVEYKQNFDFVYAYLMRDSTTKENFYQSLIDIESEETTEYVNLSKSVEDAHSKISAIYSSVGCSEDNQDEDFDIELCVQDASFSDEQNTQLEALDGEISQKTQSLNDLIANATDVIIADCWNLEDEL